MRLVLDTNVVLSGLLWNGPPALLIDAAIRLAVTRYPIFPPAPRIATFFIACSSFSINNRTPQARRRAATPHRRRARTYFCFLTSSISA